MRTVIGVDIGGSKTHGIRAVGGRQVAEAVAGSANVAAVGIAEAGRQLDTLFAQLGTERRRRGLRRSGGRRRGGVRGAPWRA